MNDNQYTLLIPSEDCEDKLRTVCEIHGIEFDDDPQSNFDGEWLSAITFSLTANAIWYVLHDLIPYFLKLGNDKKVILITPDGTQYKNITLEQAQEILQKSKQDESF